MIHFLSKTPERALRGTALVRMDFNTEDEWRVRASVPTLTYLLKVAERVLILSHRGRPAPTTTTPEGFPVHFDPKLSLRRDARALERMLRHPVHFVPHFRFPDIRALAASAPKGSVFLLENIRFLKGESTKKPELARTLAELANYYVNDAFAVCHHPSDSVARIERFLPSYAGLELEKEISFLSGVLTKPKRPLVLVLGGGKAHDKLGVLHYFKDKADSILLGGAAANTVLLLRGEDIDGSLADADKTDLQALRRFTGRKNIVMPLDYAYSGKFIYDIGPRTVVLYRKLLGSARTIVWSGPMGLIERKPFDKGTLAVARAIAANRKAFTLTGGGETVMFLRKHRLHGKFSFISTGGGALLEFLAGKKLPGIAALEESRGARFDSRRARREPATGGKR